MPPVVFRGWYRSHNLDRLNGSRWLRYWYVPVFSMVVIMALTMATWQEDPFNQKMRVLVVLAFAAINAAVLVLQEICWKKRLRCRI